MALQANITLDLNKKNTTNPRVTLRQSDQNYPSITVQVTENGQPFNGTGWEAAFEGMTSGGFFVHDSSHFDKSSTPATGTYTYVPPLQVSSDIGSFELAYFVFEKAGSPKQRTTTANFRFDIIEQADIDADVADDYVSTWQSADEKMKALQKEMEDAAAAYKKIVDGYVNDFNGKVDKINGDITAAEKRITDMVNEANTALQNILKSNNTFTGTNTFNETVTVKSPVNARNIELRGDNTPLVDFHGKNSTADYTTRLIDAGQGLLSMTQEGRHMDLSIHIANDDNPVNVDTMIGGAPDLGDGGDLHTIVVSGGGAKNLTGTFPAGKKMPYSVLENIPGTNSTIIAQRWTDFTDNTTYTRTKSGSPAAWHAWKTLAHNEDVVHKTGNETVSGNKTLDPSGLHISSGAVNTVTYPMQVAGGPNSTYHAPIRAYKKVVADENMYGWGAGGMNIFGAGESALGYTNAVIAGTVPSGLPQSGMTEATIIAADQNVWIMPNMQTPANGIGGDSNYFFNTTGNMGKRFNNANISLINANGTYIGPATPIPANANLNNYNIPGEYSVNLNATAATISNRVTTPSSQNGQAFNLTVTETPDKSLIYQRYVTIHDWIFTRRFYNGVWTPWVAQSGTMNTTIKGPHSTTIKLSRSGNLVYAHIGGFKSGEAVNGGAATVEKIPADYLPMSFATSVPEAVIRTRWDQQALVVLSNGTLKNYGGGAFNSDGEGSWLVHGETIA